MLGVHRDVVNGKAVNYELLRIEMQGNEVVYTSIPNGKTATSFRLTSVVERRVVFENPAHDFPQRILYWSSQEDELCARIEGPQGGKVVGEEWCWTRIREMQ